LATAALSPAAAISPRAVLGEYFFGAMGASNPAVDGFYVDGKLYKFAEGAVFRGVSYRSSFSFAPFSVYM
jgi:hypothetical protein